MKVASIVLAVMDQNQVEFHQFQMMLTVRIFFLFSVFYEKCSFSLLYSLELSVFLTEVIDSLERGFKEKTNPDFLILEINSSRYAYNMSLPEVNFYVVKALLNLYPIKDSNGNVLTAFNQIFAQLNGVLKNYIRGTDAMSDCLRAIEESCHQNETLKSKIAQIIHYLYDKEIITEESILAWHDDLDDDKEWIRHSLKKLIDWLNESSDEEDDDDVDSE